MKYLKKTILFGISLTCLLASSCSSAPAAKSHSDNRDGLKHPPKNIIILIGDGCGFNHLEDGVLYENGQEGTQPYEDFPVRLAVSTYSIGGSYDPNQAWARWDYVKHGATDSAAAATAIATGVKTYDSAIGVDG
ncbi:MAG: alkaline phosphatase, partial [bacterium]|nr:alkaline phosphatase [bacterium]